MSDLNPFRSWPRCLIRHFVTTYLSLCDRWILRLVDCYFWQLEPDFPTKYFQSNSSMIYHCFSKDKTNSLAVWFPVAFRYFKDKFKDNAGKSLCYLKMIDEGYDITPLFRDNPIKCIPNWHVVLCRLMQVASWPMIECVVKQWHHIFGIEIWKVMVARLKPGEFLSSSIAGAMYDRVDYSIANYLDPNCFEPADRKKLLASFADRPQTAGWALNDALTSWNKPFIDLIIDLVPDLPAKYSMIADRDIQSEAHKSYIVDTLKLTIDYDLDALSIASLELLTDDEFMQKAIEWSDMEVHSYDRLIYLFKQLVKLSTSRQLKLFLPMLATYHHDVPIWAYDGIMKTSWADKVEVTKDLIELVGHDKLYAEVHEYVTDFKSDINFDFYLLLIKEGIARHHSVLDFLSSIGNDELGTNSIKHYNLVRLLNIAKQYQDDGSVLVQIKRVATLIYEQNLEHRTLPIDLYFDIRRAHRQVQDYCDCCLLD